MRDELGVLEYVNADPIALGLSGFNPASVSFEAGRVMLRRLHELAAQRKTFAFESTLAAKSYARWVKHLRDDNYAFQLMFLWLRSPELAVQRVRERVRAGGHDVPQDVILRRYAAGIRNFWQLYQPLADSWAVYDNSNSPEPVAVASGERGGWTSVHNQESWNVFSLTKP